MASRNTEDIKLELEEVRDHQAPTEAPVNKEELQKKLREAIQEKDEDSFHRHLSGLEELLQDDNKIKKLLVGSLAYAAHIGFQPAVETVTQKGVDVNTMSAMPEDPDNPYQINCRSWRMTALHRAARGGHVDTVRCLVDKGADTNIKDNFGITPIHWAALGGHVDTVRCLVDKGADIYVIENIHGDTPLHWAAGEGHVDTIRYFVDEGADTNIKDRNGSTPLHLAACGGHVDTIRYLVDKGADTELKDGSGFTPLNLAVWIGHHVDTIICLVEQGADTNSKDDGGVTPLHLSCRGGNVETVKYLLEKGADPTAKDEDGETPLSSAILSRHKDVAAILLEHEKWEEMLRSSDEESTTPMRGLIAFMPDVAERAFSRCVTTNKGKGEEDVHADSRNLEVQFNYEFLEDFQDKQSSDKQCPSEEGATNKDTSTKSWQPKGFTKHSHPLFLTKKHGCSNLMKHPLVISLLDYKWKKFGQYIFFGNLFVYLIFLVFLTAFGLVVLSPVEGPCTEVLNGSFNGSTPEDCGELTIDEYRFLFVGATFTIATALLRLAIELNQLCRHPMEYLQDWVNWLEIPLYLCSIIFTFVFATPCLCVYNWQWQMGVVAVFLGWMGLISFLQKWPVTGIYVLMFINIIQSFLKIAFLALLLVIAFALAFYMLFFEPDEMRNAFSHPGRAIVKVMTMTTGELDYEDLFHQQEGEEEIAFPPVSFILWIIFLVLMPVLLSNLLVGLAVGDVDRLQETASEKRIELQIDLVLTIEEMLEFMHLRHRFVIKGSEKCYPNAVETLLPNWFKGRKANEDLAGMAEDEYERPEKVRRWIAKRYAKWGISNDYSTSGVNICDRIEKPQIDLEPKLQQQSQHKEQLEAELQQHFQEAIKQLSEEHAQKSEEQAKETRQLAGEVATLREQLQQQNKKQKEQLEHMLQQHIQEAIKQLSEEQTQRSEKQAKEMNKQTGQLAGEVASIKQLTEEQTQKSEEQTKEMREQTAQLAGEVATLREALQKLITKMDV